MKKPKTPLAIGWDTAAPGSAVTEIRIQSGPERLKPSLFAYSAHSAVRNPVLRPRLLAVIRVHPCALVAPACRNETQWRRKSDEGGSVVEPPFFALFSTFSPGSDLTATFLTP